MNVHVPPVVVVGAAFEAQRRTRSRAVLPLRVAAVSLASASVVIGASSLVTFAQHRTTVDPVRPSRATVLVASGPYALSRNPMYVALVGVLAAHALWKGNAVAWAPVVASWVALDRLQIRPEEKELAERFGKHYSRYAASTPRWLIAGERA